MKILHESPLCLMNHIQQFTDGDYCLPHLMDQYEEYAKFFMRSKQSGRFIMLDNSLHELGIPYNEERIFYWLNELQPNEFFVPDYWEDRVKSTVSAKKWISYQDDYPDTMFIAVVQAQSIDEAVICYQSYKDLGYKKIAFSYGASYYNEISSHPNKFLGKALGRIEVINNLYKKHIIEDNDKIHLLGCSVPQEFGFYKNLPYIESIDTSNPVMAGIEGLRYNSNGLYIKPIVNMNECFEIPLNKIDLELVNYNIKQFKQINNL